MIAISAEINKNQLVAVCNFELCNQAYLQLRDYPLCLPQFFFALFRDETRIHLRVYLRQQTFLFSQLD